MNADKVSSISLIVIFYTWWYFLVFEFLWECSYIYILSLGGHSCRKFAQTPHCCWWTMSSCRLLTAITTITTTVMGDDDPPHRGALASSFFFVFFKFKFICYGQGRLWLIMSPPPMTTTCIEREKTAMRPSPLPTFGMMNEGSRCSISSPRYVFFITFFLLLY